MVRGAGFDACKPGLLRDSLIRRQRTGMFASTTLVICILAGCATAPTASMPTPVRCAPPDSPSPPAITAKADLAKLDDRALVLTIASERLDLIDYAGKADAVIQACR